MRLSEIEKKIGKDKLAVFLKWMNHQTVGTYEDGETDFYDEDVERFIRYKCNPDNEPMSEGD